MRCLWLADVKSFQKSFGNIIERSGLFLFLVIVPCHARLDSVLHILAVAPMALGPPLEECYRVQLATFQEIVLQHFSLDLRLHHHHLSAKLIPLFVGGATPFFTF